MSPSDPRVLTSHMICELEGTVSHNRAKVYIARSQQAENSTLAAQNYNGSFLVNRRIANENTDALFRVRSNILQRLPANDSLSKDYKDSMINRSKVEFLAFRSRVNELATSITKELAAVTAMSIAINKRIQEANDEIKDFNIKMLNDNRSVYAELVCDTTVVPTESINKALIEENLAALQDLVFHATANTADTDQLLLMTEQNNNDVMADAKLIAQDRKELLVFNGAIMENRSVVAAGAMIVQEHRHQRASYGPSNGSQSHK